MLQKSGKVHRRNAREWMMHNKATKRANGALDQVVGLSDFSGSDIRHVLITDTPIMAALQSAVARYFNL